MAIVRYYKDPKTGSLIGVDEEGKGHIQKLFNIPTNGMIGGNASLPDNIIADETGLYQVKDEKVYPISNPDLSTQPSILPQRFGVFDIKEVLVKVIQEPIELDTNSVNTFYLSSPIFQYDGQISFNEPSGFSITLLVFNSNKEMALTVRDNERVYYAYNPTKWYDLKDYNADELGSNTIIYPLYSNYPYFKYFIATESTGTYKRYYYFDGVRFQETTLESLYSEGYKDYVVELDPEIPSSATIISASSFNANACVPAICKKEDGKWTITNNEDIEPDFTLVQYYEESDDYYYVPQEEEEEKEEQERTIIATLRSDPATRTVPGLNVADVWGYDGVQFTEGSIIGRVTVDGGTPSDLIAANNGSSLHTSFGTNEMDIPRFSGMNATIYDSFDLTVELYAL